MSVEKVIDLDAIRRRIPDIPQADMSVAERDRADLLALLDEARRVIEEAFTALKATSPYVDDRVHGYARAVGRAESIATMRTFLARFPTPSPTDEEKT